MIEEPIQTCDVRVYSRGNKTKDRKFQQQEGTRIGRDYKWNLFTSI
jgi:hypothetical protein